MTAKSERNPELPGLAQVVSLPAEDLAKLRCCVCGSGEWWRCRPGTSEDATPYPPHLMGNVAMMPGKVIEIEAWCRSCDPILR